jgi:hypothetical protein
MEWRCASKVREQMVFAEPVDSKVNRCVNEEVMPLTIHGLQDVKQWRLVNALPSNTL